MATTSRRGHQRTGAPAEDVRLREVVGVAVTMPIQVVLVQIRDHRHGRRGGQQRRLLTGDLRDDDRTVARRQVRKGRADVACDDDVDARAGEQVPEERRGGALALGAGDADGAAPCRDTNQSAALEIRIPERRSSSKIGCRHGTPGLTNTMSQALKRARCSGPRNTARRPRCPRAPRSGPTHVVDGLDAGRARGGGRPGHRDAFAAETPDPDGLARPGRL